LGGCCKYERLSVTGSSLKTNESLLPVKLADHPIEDVVPSDIFIDYAQRASARSKNVRGFSARDSTGLTDQSR